ncbi:DcrB-related protein [Pasteurellaceae bacterium LIM206]|nr:DcrB-related protein [Pasteurellaceae bacterium LIM206]
MFYFNEGSLDISAEWQDRSIILLSHPSQFNISVTRDEIPLGMTFPEFAENQFKMVSRQLRGYKELHRKPTKVDGYEAVMSEFEWDSPEGRLHQISTLINLPVHPTVITLSSHNPLTENQKDVLLKLLYSFKARK